MCIRDRPSTAPTETNKPDEPQGGGEKTTINVIISQYGNYTQEWWTQFEKDFEAANDTVDLNIEIVSWNDIYSVVSTRIQSKQQPDILNISGFADYVADDLLMKAEDYISEEVKNNFIPASGSPTPSTAPCGHCPSWPPAAPCSATWTC